TASSWGETGCSSRSATRAAAATLSGLTAAAAALVRTPGVMACALIALAVRASAVLRLGLALCVAAGGELQRHARHEAFDLLARDVRTEQTMDRAQLVRLFRAGQRNRFAGAAVATGAT